MKKILTFILIFLFLISSNIYLVNCQNTIPFLDGFDYRKSFYLESSTTINIISKITVFNQTGTDTNKNIYNYNLNQPDFDDIRITTNDGLTLVGAYSNIIKLQDTPNIREIFIIVNNHFSGFAPETVNQIKRELNISSKNFAKQKKLTDFF